MGTQVEQGPQEGALFRVLVEEEIMCMYVSTEHVHACVY